MYNDEASMGLLNNLKSTTSMTTPFYELILTPTTVILIICLYLFLSKSGRKLSLGDAHYPSFTLLQTLPPLNRHPVSKDAALYKRIRRKYDLALGEDDAEFATSREFEAPQEIDPYRKQLLDLKRSTEQLTKERDQLAQALIRMQMSHQALVEESKSAALDHLQTEIAHELNNALNVVRGVIGPLHRNIKELSGPTSSMSQDILREVHLLMKYLSESADRACMTATDIIKTIPSRRTRELNRSASREDLIAKLDRLRISYPEITFNFQLQYEDFEAYGDPAQLMAALDNLLMNAVEASFGRENAKVDMTIIESKRQLHITVIDNGVGIPDELKETIFEPSYTTKARHNMLGLGLFALRHFVSKANGSVQVKDNPSDDGGTIFSVCIPVLRSNDRLSPIAKKVA